MTAVANRAGLFSEASRRAAAPSGRADARRPAGAGIGPAGGLGLVLAGLGLAAGLPAASTLGLALLPACMPLGLLLRRRMRSETPDAPQDAGAAIAVVESDGTLLDATHAARERLGLAEREGASLLQLVHILDRPGLLASLMRVRDTGCGMHIRFRPAERPSRCDPAEISARLEPRQSGLVAVILEEASGPEPHAAAPAIVSGAVDPADGGPDRAVAPAASCDAAEATSFAVRLLQAEADRVGVRVLCEIEDATPLAACGQRDCRSAMLDLLGHALRISLPGDVVRVSLRGVRGALLLRVGAPARQDRRETEAALAGVRERIEAVGGSLLVESRPGCGTLASIRLPVLTPAGLLPAPRHLHPAGTI